MLSNINSDVIFFSCKIINNINLYGNFLFIVILVRMFYSFWRLFVKFYRFEILSLISITISYKMINYIISFNFDFIPLNVPISVTP